MVKRGCLIRVILFVFIGILSLAFLLNPVNARQSKTYGNEIMVDLVRYDPSPVQQGESFEVWFELRNIYGSDLSDIKLELAAPYPLSQIRGENYSREFPTLEQGMVEEFMYTLNVNDNAADGYYSVSIGYYSNRLKKIIIEKFNVKVQKVGTDISTTSVSVEPRVITTNVIAPGEAARVDIKISNTADSMMKDITVKLDLNSSAIPFAPLGSTAEKKIKEIPSGKAVSASFDILALANTEAGAYKIPVKITYYDELGVSYTKDDLITLIVGSIPKIHLELRENEIYNVRGTGNVVLNLVNEGLTDIKATKVLLKEPTKRFSIFGLALWKFPAYKVLSEDYIYVGEIDVDDTESVQYRLKLNTFDRKIILPLIITYSDSNNKEYTEERDFEFEIYGKKDMGIATTSYWWLVALIIVILIFLDFRIWKKRYKEHGFLDYLTDWPTRFTSKFHRK